MLPEDTDQDDEDGLVAALGTRGRRWSGNAVQVYATRPSALRRAIAMQDPIVDSRERDAQSLMGTEIRRLLRQLGRVAQ